MARRNEKLPMVKLVLELDNCSGCPFVTTHRTLNAGCATDYYCGHPTQMMHDGRKEEYRPASAIGPCVMGYVEYSSDHQPIPRWCPIRLEPAPPEEYKDVGANI